MNVQVRESREQSEYEAMLNGQQKKAVDCKGIDYDFS